MRTIAIILIIGLLIPLSVEAQIFRKHKRADNDSLGSGKYYEFWGSDSSMISAKGHLYQGSACKTWKYYDRRRKLYRIALYENGVETQVLYGPEDPLIYD